MNNKISDVVNDLFGTEVPIVITRPDPQFGDFATNVALQIARPLGKNPRDVAEQIAAQLRDTGEFESVTVAGPGFINIRLTDTALLQGIDRDISALSRYNRVLLEYSCPNAFKELHTGHLYQTIVGDAIGRILEATGTQVFRANFGGDVGLHVAKCLYGIELKLGGLHPEELADVPVDLRPSWISETYVLGAKAYEEDVQAKARITDINALIYAFHNTQDHDSPIAKIYWQCREWSYEYFKSFYQKIRVAPFDKYYPESMTFEPGLAIVRQHTGSVFNESEGAIIYEGESAGLHTRVFVTSKGLPTYETKDLGTITLEASDFEYDKRVLITGNDQSEYMKVVFAALSEIDPGLAAKQTHFTNGTVRFAGGQKMSSRLGNVTRATDVVETISDVVAEANPGSDHYSTALAAIKYSFLKHRLGGDIAFDIHESVSLDGNSGPYLQYAHARARSILAKSELASQKPEIIQQPERALLRKLTEYKEVVEKSTHALLPHHIATYLYELAQEFNSFYEHNRVIGDEREALRLWLVEQYAETLCSGLGLLGIDAPDVM